jgi:serine/threonine protein kinase
MPPGSRTWWTDERVAETVTPAYVHSHLRANEQEILGRSLYHAGDLTDNTYLDWIVLRAKRLFLILVDAGVPDQIFGVIDDSFEDDDLPIAQHIVPTLRLSIEHDAALDKRFYKAQFKFLARILQDGEHIRYAEEESVPLTVIGIKPSALLNKDSTDAVRLPSGTSGVLVRKRVALNTKTTEAAILSEIAELKKFSHEHVLSVFASYVQGDSLYILSTPAGEYSLKTFLMDQPKAYDALPKPDRRRKLINWLHCLANAVAWLHYNGGHHGAIRPSNVHVTQDFNVCLGSMDGEGVLCSTAKADDIESYQYAPPERWKRSVTVQNTGHGKVSLPSGNRSGRKAQRDEDSNDPSTRRSGSTLGQYSDKDEIYTFQAASKSEFSRLKLSNTPNSGRQSSLGSRLSTRNGVDGDSIESYGMSRRKTTKPPSVMSSNSSEGRPRAFSDPRKGIFVAAPEHRTAVVQTWRSVQHDSFAADVYTLGAVIMDILTVLCKRTYSAFARHRSKNNRNAGRGGGLADASFHANPSQVLSWAQIL